MNNRGIMKSGPNAGKSAQILAERRQRRQRRGRDNGIKDFSATQVTYNRNGISGRPFYSVVFSYVEGETLKSNMLAVVPDEGTDEECFVVDMNDPSQCWRGVDFLEYVAAAIKEADWASWKPTTAWKPTTDR
jgi:hypothetical protein